MKSLFLVCLGLLVLQQTNALFYHDWYDWYDDDVSPYCKTHLGEIAWTIKQKVTAQQLETMDKQLLECLVEQKVLGYIIKDSPQQPGNQMTNFNIPPQNSGLNVNMGNPGNTGNVNTQDLANLAMQALNS